MGNLFPADYGRRFKEMQDARENADYRFEKELTREDAQSLLEFAEEFCARVTEQVEGTGPLKRTTDQPAGRRRL